MKRLSLLTLLFVTITAFGQDKMTPELLWEMDRVGAPAVSPDGKMMVYGVSDYSLEANSGNTNLYLQPVMGEAAKMITSFKGYEGGVQWRVDGKKIGFLCTESGSTQVWEMNPDGSNKKQLTDIEGGISNFQYSPDMKHISYTRNFKMDNTVADIYPDLPKANARIIDELMYRHWDSWHDYKYSHVCIMGYEDGKVDGAEVDIMSGERFDAPLKPFGGASQINWNHNGSGIAYTCKKLNGKDWAESTNSEIYFYDLKTGKTKNLTQGMKGYDMDPIFSPDGSKMAWMSMDRPGFEADKNRIYLMDIATGAKMELTEGWDQTAGHIHFSHDSKKIFFNSVTNATYQLYEITVADKKIRQITKGTHNYYSIAEAGKYVVGLKASMKRPNEIYRVDLKKGTETALTDVNGEIYKTLKTGKVEERWIKTTDGKDMLTWIIYPPDFDPNKKYPALLYCQGGPQSAVSQFFSFRWNFQLMAANDYIIVAPNRRGLPSFGQEWNDQISGDWGGQAMNDYLSAIDAVKKEKFVDEERLGAVGASYGGYSVYWLAGNHEKRFKAFISHCGLFNLESWYGSTEEMFFANFDIKGPYWDKDAPISYEKHSPHKYVRYWDTPILVVHGQKDFRVPLGEGLQAFHAAQLRNIPSRFLYFPEEGHWVLGPQNGVLWHRVFFEWLDTYLK